MGRFGGSFLFAPLMIAAALVTGQASAGILKIFSSIPGKSQACVTALAKVRGGKKAQTYGREQFEARSLQVQKVSKKDLNSLKDGKQRFSDLVEHLVDEPFVMGRRFPAQEVFRYEQLTAPEQHLVDELMSAAKDPVLVAAARNSKGTQDLIRDRGLGLSLNDYIDIIEAIHPESKGKMEVGAWRVLLKTGESLSVVFTSGNLFALDGAESDESLMKALGTLRDVGKSIGDVAAIQFFHTHPGLMPLNDVDFKSLNRAMSEFDGLDIATHFYAISETVQGKRYVFHNGVELVK